MKGRRRAVTVIALGLTAACGGVLIHPWRGGDDAPVPGRPPAATAKRPAGPGPMTRVVDRRSGFAILVPGAWTRRRTADPAVRLLAGGRGSAAMLVRVAHLHFDARAQPPAGLGRRAAEAFRLVRRARMLVAPHRVRVAGRAAYLCVYGAVGGAKLTHVHVVFFVRRIMFSVVFQVPTGAEGPAAGLLDRIAASFTVL